MAMARSTAQVPPGDAPRIGDTGARAAARARPAGRLRVLALVSRFKWSHIDYLHALGRHVDLTVGWSGAAHPGAVEQAAREGLRLEPLGRLGEAPREEVRGRLAALIDAVAPGVVHVMYYRHEELVLLCREVVGDRAAVVCEIRDPLTTLSGARPGSQEWEVEAGALEASDGQLLVSRALREYLDRAHGLDLRPTSLIVPHAFARRNTAPPAEKLSARDGRVHLALVGTVDERPGHGRWYGDIIRRLVAQGLVVHSRFHELEEVSPEPYRRLAAELPAYHCEPPVPFRWGTLLSDATSRYDLMGVFHELDAEHHNEAATLAVCLPTKAVSGWLHGGIPAVCTRHYGGVVELIEELGIGFVIDSLEDVGRIAADRAAIERATAACLEVRERFTHEHQASRIARFYRALAGAAPEAPSSSRARAPRPRRARTRLERSPGPSLARAFFICGTPRCGSTLLAGLLAGTGLAGYAGEHFAPANEPPWAAERFADYVEGCVRRHASAGGVFGAKLLWGDLRRTLDRLGSAACEPPATDRELLETVFPGARFLWVRRGDVVAQAVSWWKAHQTGEWYAGAERGTGVTPAFDFDEIDRLVRELDAANGGWRRWFAENGIAPHAILYEELVRDKAGTARRALEFIGVEVPPGASIVERTSRQADAVNADWIRRYRALAAARH